MMESLRSILFKIERIRLIWGVKGFLIRNREPPGLDLTFVAHLFRFIYGNLTRAVI